MSVVTSPDEASLSANPTASPVASQGAQPDPIPAPVSAEAADEAVDDAAAAVARTLAVVQGEPVTQLPLDLYIPPDALEVFLEAFEGPLDLLLYLIKKQNLDILNIPISEITAQYMQYIALMETMRFELAAEYLVMAAMLAEIKSRMLLPRVDEDHDDEDDPRAELIRRLQEYEQIKSAAAAVGELPRMEREHQQLQIAAPPAVERDRPLPDVSMKDLLLALQGVMQRAELSGRHSIARETLSVRARMTHVLSTLQLGGFCEFSTLFNPEEGRLGVVVSFLAVLELARESLIDIVQDTPFAPIYIKTRAEISGAAQPE
ncbi:MAG: segregation/condensation protein A [Gammaproteobacteria bacterium]|nr:MAG: segregation/condensation protein A [Gammaproteobacteria bacterium]PIE37941.1 MAG: segregation/condensation protein A [Gammaproteobacteria bacterium]